MESATQASCFDCALRPDRVFCDLPAEALHAFDTIKEIQEVPKGTPLLHEGRAAKGIFVLCDGRAKLTVCSDNGKRLMLRIASPGEILGLSATMSGKPYEVSAEALDGCQVAFVRRKELLNFLREHREACLQVVRMLSQDLHTAYDRVRTVGLARTRRSRTARCRA